MTIAISEEQVERAARAVCLQAGDDPDRMTYAHEMACTGRDREPKERWRYWESFCRAALEAAALGGVGEAGAVARERLWCLACGTVTRDNICDCNRWDDGNGMYREPNFVNYADALQKELQQIYEERASAPPAASANAVRELYGRLLDVEKYTLAHMPGDMAPDEDDEPPFTIYGEAAAMIAKLASLPAAPVAGESPAAPSGIESGGASNG